MVRKSPAGTSSAVLTLVSCVLPLEIFGKLGAKSVQCRCRHGDVAALAEGQDDAHGELAVQNRQCDGSE